MLIRINFYANVQCLHDLLPLYIKSQKLIYVLSLEGNNFLFIPNPLPIFLAL